MLSRLTPASQTRAPGGRLRSFGYAGEGLLCLFRTQPNWRIHLLLATGVLGAAVLFAVTPVELAILSLTVGLVLGLEARNTALEAAVDALGLPPSGAAKRAKDTAAAAVLVGAVTAVVVASCIFVPRVLAVL